MARLIQLADPEHYHACDWDLKEDARGRAYWVQHFCGHLELLAAAIAEEYPEAASARLNSFREEYLAAMRSLEAEPHRHERIDILYMDELRNRLLQRYGFEDPYRGIKSRENETALELLPELLAELDGCAPQRVMEKLAFGLMAGNLFDLGAMAAVRRYRAPSADFRRARATQSPRPWLVDDLEAWEARWAARSAYRQVAFFVDNAGSDICLGCLPLVRWMLRGGSRVTLAANSRPALNDVTAPELPILLETIATTDDLIAQTLADHRLSVCPSGGWAPLIDLTQLTAECVSAIARADLIILHGMGRAIESNSRARFTCDSLRVAVLKDPAVARRLGGGLFDCVFRFEGTG